MTPRTFPSTNENDFKVMVVIEAEGKKPNGLGEQYYISAVVVLSAMKGSRIRSRVTVPGSRTRFDHNW